MKNFITIAFLFVIQFAFSQIQSTNWNTFYKQQQSEKVYAHLNNVLYLPEETVFYKLYVTNASNSPTTQSDYVYVDIYDSSNKKIETQTYLIEHGSSSGSFTITKDMPAGMYLLKAYTKFQEQLGEASFEKHFFIQKVISPRVLMSLDFKKKGYGAGDTCEVDFTLKSNDNEPIRNQKINFDVFIDGKIEASQTATTNQEGKVTLQFQLPENLKSNDGIINVKVDYDNFKESITKSIPINLEFADLQFLPESGNYLVNHPSSLFFISKNEFGKPLDVSGYIEDEQGNKIQDFASFYDGMGKLLFTPAVNKKYFAVIISPFKSKEKFLLPSPLLSGYVLSVQPESNKINLEVYASENSNGEILIRNQDKVYQSASLKLKSGSNTLSIETNELPMGVYAISLVINDKIYAERLIFINYQDGLQIEINSDKNQYKPREKVKVSIFTKDKNSKPIASNLSISVVDEKLLSYIDDKQHNLLTWMFLGFELKGKIHEPQFYFDEKEALEKRLSAIDLLLNTHGWRRFDQKEVNEFEAVTKNIIPEKSSDIEGFVLDNKNKPKATKILLFTDFGKVYETKSDKSGYFKFVRTHFEKNALLVVESKKSQKYTIKNSVSNFNEIIKLKDSLKISNVDYKTYETIAKPNVVAESSNQVTGGAVNLNSDNSLEEVVIVGYGVSRQSYSVSISHVISHQITQNLFGSAAGVQIQSATGQPGLANKVLIRGVGTIYGSRASSQPLYVIDGIPYANNEHTSIFSSLSPGMIQSVTVLKNENATSLYGSNGMNGVILITTNKHHGGRGILLGKTNHYTFENINKYTSKKLNTPTAFYAPVYSSTQTDKKTDFRNCIYWNSIVQTSSEGKAKFEFYNSDETSTFSILAEGTSFKGDLGSTKYSYVVKEPIQTDLKIPLYVSQEDVIKIPLWIKNNSDETLSIQASLLMSDYFEAKQSTQTIDIKQEESVIVYFPVTAQKIGNKIPFQISLSAKEYDLTIEKTIDIYGKGFPISHSFSGTKELNERITIVNPLQNSIQSELKVFVNPYNALSDGLEGMLREPHGCFEQVSSVNYPNIMALQLMNAKGVSPETKQKALQFLTNGYKKLKNYESKNGGFEWYGGNPGHESLTAYGLLQFHEMSNFISIDQNLVKRSIEWLYSRKDGEGGFKQNNGKYGFSAIKNEVNNAYIVYVLTEIGEKNIDKEYQNALSEALKSRDVYRSALVALAAYNQKDFVSYKKLLGNIKSAIQESSFSELKIEQTVVRSYHTSQTIEWMSLYALAIMKEQKINQELIEVLDFIQSSKKRNGFGSTQATALALKAITTFSGISKAPSNQPKIDAKLNDSVLNASNFDAGGNITLNTIDLIKKGENRFNLKISSEQGIPFLFYVNYFTYIPDNSPQCELKLTTKVNQNKLKVSETARLEIQVSNLTKSVVQNPIVRIGIPGGTSPEPWQLKELVEKEIVDYYEIFESEVVFYFREMDALETRKINLDLKAQLPGNYQGIASSAYLYYNNEHKNWNSGLQVEITE